MNEKVIEKLQNEELLQKLLVLKSKDEVEKFFVDESVEVTDDEVEELGSLLCNACEVIKKIPEEELKSITAGTGDSSEKNPFDPKTYDEFAKAGLITPEQCNSFKRALNVNNWIQRIAGGLTVILAAGVVGGTIYGGNKIHTWWKESKKSKS